MEGEEDNRYMKGERGGLAIYMIHYAYTKRVVWV